MNKKIELLLLLLLLFSCKTQKKHEGIWVAEELFIGMSMEIKTDGNVLFSNIPVIKPNIYIDLEGNAFVSSDEPIFDAIQKEGCFDKETFSINIQNNGNIEKCKIIFSDGRTLDLLLESGYLITFKKAIKL
jgi:hypothetical protein